MRIGGRRDLAHFRGELAARQRRQRNACRVTGLERRERGFGHVADDVDVARPRELVDGLAGRHVLAGVCLFGSDRARVIGDQRRIAQLVLRERELLLRLVALRERRRVAVFGLFELRGGDQVFARLRAIAVELLLREREAVRRGVELRLRAGGVLFDVGRIEQCDDLARLDGIAEPHLALDDLARDTERQRCCIARLDLAGQRGPGGGAVGVHGQRDDRTWRGWRGFLRMTGGEDERGADQQHGAGTGAIHETPRAGESGTKPASATDACHEWRPGRTRSAERGCSETVADSNTHLYLNAKMNLKGGWC
ncbi:hypothetical protein BLAT2472_10948 [Burkholderia latens]